MNDVVVTPRAAAVLRRGLEAARLDPSLVGIRVWSAGGRAQSGFADAPDPGDATVHAGDIRVFVDPSIAEHGPVAIDVSEEHEQIVVVPLD